MQPQPLHLTPCHGHLNLATGRKQQHRRRRAVQPAGAIEPLQPRPIPQRCIDQVEIANRPAQELAADLAFAAEGKGIQRQQRSAGLAIDQQSHAIALQHGDDPLVAGEGGKAARLLDVGNRQAPAKAVQPFATVAGDLFGEPATVLPRHARVILRTQQLQLVHLLKRPSRR